MSECGGAHTFSNPVDENVAGVGKTLNGVRSKIDKPDADGNGEVNNPFFLCVKYDCNLSVRKDYNFFNNF